MTSPVPRNEIMLLNTPGPLSIPAIADDQGDHAVRRFAEFFTATIHNPNTR